MISAPSMRVCRSALEVSAPRSFPARSTKENLPCTLPLVRRRIWKQAWEREELELANVCPEVLWQRRTKKGYELLGGRSPATMAPEAPRLSSPGGEGDGPGLLDVLCHPVPIPSFLPWAAALLPPATLGMAYPGSQSTEFYVKALVRAWAIGRGEA